MMANVIIKMDENGVDIPQKVIDTINTMMRINITEANTTMTVDGIRYTIFYKVIGEDEK